MDGDTYEYYGRYERSEDLEMRADWMEGFQAWLTNEPSPHIFGCEVVTLSGRISQFCTASSKDVSVLFIFAPSPCCELNSSVSHDLKFLDEVASLTRYIATQINLPRFTQSTRPELENIKIIK